MHIVLGSCLGLSLSRTSMVRLNDRPNMTIAVYHGHKATNQSIPVLCILRIL